MTSRELKQVLTILFRNYKDKFYVITPAKTLELFGTKELEDVEFYIVNDKDLQNLTINDWITNHLDISEGWQITTFYNLPF